MIPSGNSFCRNVHTCEPSSQYASRVQLSPTNTAATRVHSPLYGNYSFDVPTVSSNPVLWATLPRRNNQCLEKYLPSASNSPRVPSPLPNNSPTFQPQSVQSTTSSRLTKSAVPSQHSALLHNSEQQRMHPSSPKLIHRSPQKNSSKVSPPMSKSIIEQSLPTSTTCSEGKPTLSAAGITTTSSNVLTDNRRPNQMQNAQGFCDVKQVRFQTKFSCTMLMNMSLLFFVRIEILFNSRFKSLPTSVKPFKAWESSLFRWKS